MPDAFQKPWALILAAGQSNRAAAGRPKQFLPWRGVPLYWHSARAMSHSACIGGIVFVFPADARNEEEKRLQDLHRHDNLGLPFLTADGGPLRQDSVRLGLALVPQTVKHVLIHDAARPFLQPALIRGVCATLHQGAVAVVPAVPVTDTIKVVANNLVTATLPRNTLSAVQTPQGFRLDLLRRAHAAARAPMTDDAALMEQAGHDVRVIAGDAANTKITWTGDLDLLADPPPMPCPRVGFGYDVHRYVGKDQGRPLKLGGIAIAGAPEVAAHSDGDVLLHALADALLGCAGMDDIGRHFPDSDERYNNISSTVLLDHVLELLRNQNIVLQNVDMTIIAQKPRIYPYSAEIRKNVARLLGLSVTRVNLKATTEEGLGFTGRCEGVKVCAIASALTDLPNLSQTTLAF
ncbi:MAG: bifunctional 2-C-methyl-D-erythritol 4-phosphate cytidylyltransferase/ 2-C-methyl-D-erythritol 2,4-cyclodiphosphate synthase [Candidatus Desulfovibrio kirbyi]|uniref:Bifunctional enzyme IspD/IspF n=1 Tax=Candidatus Desulfovibrio kirbyi TaxID=2696086 RepID=A0A6L2R586_9BACT|nr:MAG: bifunctional 2-C-methyl-D-erythritol 4-phosphate cytidylyltransferase/ 2-C-methyl-D-erythritol 2,4-cyclodiphosphate synthase [Candidatus Desulfovibrio kirbyi]